MKPVMLTADNFKEEVLETSGLILIDCYADWCGPCKMMAPILEEIAEERQDVKVCKVNVDEQPAIAQAFQVSSIPLLIVVKDGSIVQQISAKGIGIKTAFSMSRCMRTSRNDVRILFSIWNRILELEGKRSYGTTYREICSGIAAGSKAGCQ